MVHGKQHEVLDTKSWLILSTKLRKVSRPHVQALISMEVDGNKAMREWVEYTQKRKVFSHVSVTFLSAGPGGLVRCG